MQGNLRTWLNLKKINKPEINRDSMKLFNDKPIFKYNKALVYFYKIHTV